MSAYGPRTHPCAHKQNNEKKNQQTNKHSSKLWRHRENKQSWR